MINPMITYSTAGRPAVLSLAFLGALVAVLTALVGAAPASAAMAPGAQTRVGASHLAGPILVGPSVGVVAGQRLGNEPAGQLIVVATGVAADGASSGLAFPGGLTANDAFGGRVLAHVGLDDAALAARGLPEASTFLDRATAEGALADVQSANAAEIQPWLAGAKPGAQQAFAATFDTPVGGVLYQGGAESIDGSAAIAVLRANPSSPLGYSILTGYVAP
jgi:hypothetical protein